MILSDKKLWLFFTALLGLTISCSTSKNMQSDSSQNISFLEFTEERRLNHPIKLPETTIIQNLKELTELYSKLEDPSIPRSAPIPYFDEETETILVLKPILENESYGDIEIEKIEQSNSTLKIFYRETENLEYKENKQSQPIVIIKVFTKPSEIILNKINY